MTDLIYTGVGSRNISNRTRDLMVNIGAILAELGWTLRSGAANGSDAAFELGCDSKRGKKEIYLPFPGFNGHVTGTSSIPDEAYDVAKRLHPAWSKLATKRNHDVLARFHARNVQQVLGQQLSKPSKFLVCFTPDGCVNHKSRTITTGGTGTAISVADTVGVPIFNLQTPVGYKHMIEFVKRITNAS